MTTSGAYALTPAMLLSVPTCRLQHWARTGSTAQRREALQELRRRFPCDI